MPEALILVDAQNRRIGQAGKRTVHEHALLHRAFSIVLVDREGRLLLQQRHPGKYHSGGLWANSCCGHPRPGETTLQAAHRRLGEELGAAAPLRFGFRTHYRAELDHGLTENEIVYVYFGPTPPAVEANPVEISALRSVTLPELQRDVRRRPEIYAAWLRVYLVSHGPAIAAQVAKTMRTVSKTSRTRKRPNAQPALG
jgi:isopentenyl-diphosphate delta-isomerase